MELFVLHGCSKYISVLYFFSFIPKATIRKHACISMGKIIIIVCFFS